MLSRSISVHPGVRMLRDRCALQKLDSEGNLCPNLAWRGHCMRECHLNHKQILGAKVLRKGIEGTMSHTKFAS